MTPYWYIENNFLSSREGRIGASDISALLVNPDKPSESLAGYGQTAVTLWQQKTGRADREPAKLRNEKVSLARIDYAGDRNKSGDLLDAFISRRGISPASYSIYSGDLVVQSMPYCAVVMFDLLDGKPSACRVMLYDLTGTKGGRWMLSEIIESSRLVVDTVNETLALSPKFAWKTLQEYLRLTGGDYQLKTKEMTRKELRRLRTVYGF